MKAGSAWLTAAACLSLAAALAHLAIIAGGPDWYRAMGAGERMARAAERGHAYPALATAAVALILVGWAAFAASGAGLIVRLPLLRPALVAITLIYLARGMVVFWPDLLRRPDLTPGFVLWSSLIVLAIGAVHAVGVWKAWPLLAPSGRG